MNIILIADAFPPLRTSCAVLWRDLALSLLDLGHKPIVVIPSVDIKSACLVEDDLGIEVIRLKALKTKDINRFRRTINEFIMPYLMLRNLSKSSLLIREIHGIVWYSPTIFFGPLVKSLKKLTGAKSYLVLRDIFPEWAVDLGVMRKGIIYRLFKMVANYQYSVADKIGVQSPGNLKFLSNYQVEVLNNWLGKSDDTGCGQDLQKKIESKLGGKKIFVYAGNMGVAQGMDRLIDLASALKSRSDVGFLLLGRGSELAWMKAEVLDRKLDNVLFYDEVDSAEIPGVLSFCYAGLVFLDPRHRTHNIPGKFLSYMRAGIPVLANINHGNDLEKIIIENNVGKSVTDNSIDSLHEATLFLIDNLGKDKSLSQRCKSLSQELFSAEIAAKQLVAAFC